MIVAKAIEPDKKVITRVHFCPTCFAAALPDQKNRGITPHYIWFHRVEGAKVLYLAACLACDCVAHTGTDGLVYEIERTKNAYLMPITEWNALVIFQDDGYP